MHSTRSLFLVSFDPSSISMHGIVPGITHHPLVCHSATMTHAKQLVSVRPEELRFQFELEQQSYCDLKVTNNTEHNVAFKVKTTSPKKYYVRPNTGVIHPWDSCVIRVTLQAQKEYPPEMQCKDKFLLQSTVLPPNTDVDDLPQDTFNKEGAKTLEECKLRVVYMPPHTSSEKLDDGIKQTMNSNSDQALQRLQDERDKAVRQTQQLRQDLEILKRQINRGTVEGSFSFKFSLLVGLIGVTAGFLLKLLMSNPSTD